MAGYMLFAPSTNTFMLEKNENRYAHDLTYALLKSTIQRVTYRDSMGNQIVLKDKTIEHLISEDLYLRSMGKVNIGTLRAGLEEKINRTLRDMASPNYEYFMVAKYHGVEMHLGIPDLPATKMSYTTHIDMPTNNEKAVLTMYVWRVS